MQANGNILIQICNFLIDDSVITKAEFIGRFAHNQPEMNTIAQGLFLTFDVNRDDTITHHDLDLFYQRMDSDRKLILL